jgi:hypothetical protein
MSQKKVQLLNPLSGNINVAGVITASSFVGGLTGNVVGGLTGNVVGDVTGDVTGTATTATTANSATTATTATNAQGLTGTPNISVGSVTAASGAFSGNVSVGGTLSYQDVENIDSIGIITAQQGIQVLANGLDITGVGTFKSNVSIADSIIHTGDTDTAIRFPAADTFTVHTNGSERTRVDGDGRLLVATSSASGTHKLQVNGSAQIRVGESLILQNAAGSAEGSIECAGAGSNTDIRIRTNSTERLRVTHAGNIGIGSASPGFPVVIYADANRNSIAIRNAGSGTEEGRLYWYASDNTTIRAGISGQENGLVLFSGGATEALRLDSSQRLLKGHTASEALNYTGAIQVQGTNSTTSAITVKTNQNDSGGAGFVLAKSRGSLGGNTVVQVDDVLGSIFFNGADGTDAATPGAEIAGEVDGTPGSNDMPGRLVFKTTPDGSPTPSERLKIDSRGSFQFSNGFMNETVKINTTARNGTQAVNLDDGMVHYFSTNSSGTWKPNFTMSAGDDINATIAIGDVFSPTMIVAKGATSHYSTTIQVDGSDVTPEFSGGAPSDGGGSGTFDVYNYTIIKTGDDTFKAFAAVSTYE